MSNIRLGKDIPGGTAGMTTDVGSDRKASVATARQAAAVSRDVVQKSVDATSAPNQDKLDQAVSRLRDYVQSMQRDLHFQVDDGSGRMVIKVIDRKTQEVVRQIPEQVVLDLAQKLNAHEPIQLFSAQA